MEGGLGSKTPPAVPLGVKAMSVMKIILAFKNKVNLVVGIVIQPSKHSILKK